MITPGHETNNISFTEGAALTKRFRDQMKLGQHLGGLIGKAAFTALLEQEGCVGVRYYFGLNGDNESEIVFVGVDADGNDLIGDDKLCLDKADKCPPNCGDLNILNS